MRHCLACAICCSMPLVFSFSSLLNLGSKTVSCTQQTAGFSPTPPFQRGVPCISGTARELVAGQLPDLLWLFRCLLLAMLFFACSWPCSSYVDSSDRLERVIRTCCLLSRNGFCCSSPSSVSLGGPPDCNANSLFQLCHWLFSSPCACDPRLFSADPNSILWVARHRAVLDNLTLPLPVFFTITGSSGCDSFSVLSSSDVASFERRVPRWRHFVVV